LIEKRTENGLIGEIKRGDMRTKPV